MLIFSSFNLKKKMNKQINYNLIDKWYNYYFKLNTTLISEENIKEAFNYFMKEKINIFPKDFYYYCSI